MPTRLNSFFLKLSRKHWIISTLVLLYLAYSGLWWWVLTPIPNPWPQDSFTIRGRFPFDKGYELMFYQNVYGKAPWHQRLCGGGIFYLLGYETSEATCSNADRGVWTKPKKLNGEHYEVTLHRDLYFHGLQQWTANTWHVQYKANSGVDYKKLLITDYGAPENSACADSEEWLRLHREKLFCMPQAAHGDFKSLVITEGHPVGPNERIQNFWLDSELDQMLHARP